MRKLLARLRRDQRGQAAIEYAFTTSTMLIATAAGAPFVMKFAPEMTNALQIYIDGFYFVLSLPIP